MNWRTLFPLIFLFSCVDGFISNWLYPAKLPFLLKDILISIVYFLFFIVQYPGKQQIAQFKRSIGMGTWYLAIILFIFSAFQIFNPGVPNILVGILGFKTMFFYWLLAIVSYVYIDSVDTLRRFIKRIVYFSVPICIFGIYQFFQGPDYLVNTFGEGFRRALVVYAEYGKTAMRVIGTFGATGQFSNFLLINSLFIITLLFSSGSKIEKSIMIGCLGLNYIAMLATGSRGAILLLFITTSIFVILCRWLWRTFFIIFIISVSLNFGFNYLGRAVFGRFKTLQNVEMLRQRTFEVTSYTFKQYLEQYPFGKGLGTASAASRHLVERGSMDLEFVENYPAKLQCELGIIGVILFYLLILKLSIHWIRYWIKIRDRNTYIFTAALRAYCLTMFGYASFGMIDSPPHGLFLWALLGMAAKIATLPSNDKYPLST